MRDLSPKIINLRTTYEKGMGNVLKVINKEFHRVLDGNGVYNLPNPYRLKRVEGEYCISKIWTTPDEVWVEETLGQKTELSKLHMDDQADLYTNLIHLLR